MTIFRACHHQTFDCPVGVWVIEEHAIIFSATVRSPTVNIIANVSMGVYVLDMSYHSATSYTSYWYSTSHEICTNPVFASFCCGLVLIDLTHIQQDYSIDVAQWYECLSSTEVSIANIG